MRRRQYVLAVILALVGSLTLTQRASNDVGSTSQSNLKGSRGKPVQNAHSITVTPWGPTQGMIDAARGNLLQHPAVQEYLKGTRFRLVSFEFVDKGKIKGNIEPPERYRAILFDYTNNRAYTAAGRFDSSDVQVDRSSVQPAPSEEEFDAAVELLSKDPKIGPAVADKTLDVYRPMPPLINGSAPVGKVNRTIAVGMQSKNGSIAPEIVGVDMTTGAIMRFASGAPPASIAAPTACGLPGAGQSPTPRGTAGQYNVIISRGGTEIWSFTVVRPSVSSGTNASGIEVLNVNYRGKRVLTRGHAPILNVQYEQPPCGPYRDWCYSEDSFTANGTDVAPGIRACTSPPSTILESGTDTGNFRGVAIYDNREEVQLVTEMQAGWYRYLMEWNFSDAGVIRPRFGFSSTTNSCVCVTHNHHVYWRFDFDILSASGNLVTENSPSGPTPLNLEGMRPRLYGQDQTWRITSSTSSIATCTLIPGSHDGNYDKYGKGDVWVLLNKDKTGCGTPLNCEIDDGRCLGCGATQINIDPFVTGESTMNADIVVWYGAHFNHHDGDNSSNSLNRLIGDHVVGPDIVLKGY